MSWEIFARLLPQNKIIFHLKMFRFVKHLKVPKREKSKTISELIKIKHQST